MIYLDLIVFTADECWKHSALLRSIELLATEMAPAVNKELQA